MDSNSPLLILQSLYSNDPAFLRYQELLSSEINYLTTQEGTFSVETVSLLMEKLWKEVNSFGHEWRKVPTLSRDLYALCSLLLADYTWKSASNSSIDDDKLQDVQRKLDLALIIGTEALRLNLHSCVRLYAPLFRSKGSETVSKGDFFPSSILKHPIFSGKEVPKFVSTSTLQLPALGGSLTSKATPSTWINTSTIQTPIIISGAMAHWPALANPSSHQNATRNWKSKSYLKQLMGHRTVPVEIGGHYLKPEWRQELMTISRFIDEFVDPVESDLHKEIGYLAQVQLFDHIEELVDDIVVPDWIIVQTEADPIKNAWLGPSGTVSPCHFDPYDNLLCQVFGSKYIRLYPPQESSKLYPILDQQGMHNTSLVDVERPDKERFPMYEDAKYLECVLKEGEMLYIPQGWWHFVKSLSPSFSVSFWWSKEEIF